MRIARPLPFLFATAALLPSTPARAIIQNGTLQCESLPTYFPRGDHWAVRPCDSADDGVCGPDWNNVGSKGVRGEPEFILYYQEDTGPVPASGETAMPLAAPQCAVYRAFSTWMNFECSAGYPNILVLEGGLYANRDRGDVFNSGGALTSFQHVVYWVEPGAGTWQSDTNTVALTTNLYYEETGIIVTSDMEFNGVNYQWRAKSVPSANDCTPSTTNVGCSTSNNKCFDVETVALHEAGHFIGFNHVSCSDAVMFPSGSGSSVRTALSIHEQTAICALYGPRPASPSSARVMGERCQATGDCPANHNCIKPTGLSSTDWGWCAKACTCTDSCSNNCPAAFECEAGVCKPGVHLTGGTTGGCTCNTLTGSCQTGCTCDPDCATCACNTTTASCQASCSCDPQCTASCTCNTDSACQVACGCDTDCTTCGCNTNATTCQASCTCDPQCTSSCGCDTKYHCETGCGCDVDCVTCACDTSYSCESGCDCDVDCDAACTCDTTWACDPDCDCDIECIACECNTSASTCESGCSCDPQCDTGGEPPVDPGTGIATDMCAPCSTGDQCSTGICVGDGTNSLCTQGCFGGGIDGGTSSTCPDGFECLPTSETTSVCWPEDLSICTAEDDGRAKLDEVCYKENGPGDSDDWYEACGASLVCFGFVPRCGGQEGACVQYCNDTDRPCPDPNQQCCFGVDTAGNCLQADPENDIIHGGCFDLRKEGEPCVAADEAICGSGLGCFHFTSPNLAKCYRRCETNPCSSNEECVVTTDACNNDFQVCCDSQKLAQGLCEPAPPPSGIRSLGFACNVNSDCETNLCVPRANVSACSRTCDINTGVGCPGDDYDIDGDGLADGGFNCIAGPAGVTGYCWPNGGVKGTPPVRDDTEPPPFVPPVTGCDCRSTGPGAAWLALLGLLGLRTRRRARFDRRS